MYPCIAGETWSTEGGVRFLSVLQPEDEVLEVEKQKIKIK